MRSFVVLNETNSIIHVKLKYKNEELSNSYQKA